MKLELSRVFLACVSAYLKSLTGSTFDFLSVLRMFCKRRSIKMRLLSGNCSLMNWTNGAVLAIVNLFATMFNDLKLPNAGEASKGSISAKPSSARRVP